MAALGQKRPPRFVTGTAELASIADAGGHGTRFWAASTRGKAAGPQQAAVPGAGRDQATPGDRQGRVAPRRACSARRLHRDEHEPPGRTPVRFTEDGLAAVDSWINQQHAEISRSEAIRCLVERGLKHRGK